MDANELERWRTGLEALAAPVVETDDPSRQFADELGHRRPVDHAFLAWCGRAPGSDSPPDPGAQERGGAGGRSLDVRLWETLVAARAEPGEASAALRALTPVGDGALTRQRDFATIEAWTETELSALHALAWLCALGGDGQGWARVWSAAAWHVAELQPDNGTNHPWALHVFLWHEMRCPGEGGRQHAEILLQNCQVTLGRPDLLSSYVLRDAARALARVEPAMGRRGA